MTVADGKARTPAGEQPTNDDLVARATELVPLLRKNAAATEAQGRLMEENIAAIEDAGLLRILLPARVGGYQRDFRTAMRVGVELGRGDGATAWWSCLQYFGSWAVSQLGDQARNEVWGKSPNARFCGAFKVSSKSTYTDGGLIVSGSWAFATGCELAQWAGLAVPIIDANGDRLGDGMGLAPVRDLAIDKTWNVVGMQGTGSHTLVADEIFIPNHRILSVTKAMQGEYLNQHEDEPMSRAAFTPILLLVLVPAQIGLAKYALEIVKNSLAKGREITYTFYKEARLAPSIHLQIAQAAQLIDTAELHMMRSATVIDEAANAGVELNYETRARVRADISTTVLRCREAVDLLLNVQGAGSFAAANPLQRVWRDLEAAGRHAAANPAIGYEVYGRATLGVIDQVTDMI